MLPEHLDGRHCYKGGADCCLKCRETKWTQIPKSFADLTLFIFHLKTPLCVKIVLLLNLLSWRQIELLVRAVKQTFVQTSSVKSPAMMAFCRVCIKAREMITCWGLNQAKHIQVQEKVEPGSKVWAFSRWQENCSWILLWLQWIWCYYLAMWDQGEFHEVFRKDPRYIMASRSR